MECLKCGKEAHVSPVRRAGCGLVEKARNVAFRRAITLLQSLILFICLVRDRLSVPKTSLFGAEPGMLRIGLCLACVEIGVP